MPRLASLASAAAAVACIPALAWAVPVNDCRIGVYRLQTGEVVTIDPSLKDTFRWRKINGEIGALHPNADGVWTSTRGWTDHDDGHRVTISDCGAAGITFDGVKGERIPLEVTETLFKSGGVTLAGRLVMPKGAGKVPVVVLVHGSEKYSARDYYASQRLLPTQGIGVFVYDKRGTVYDMAGETGSTGQYTQDFSILADDAVAAVAEARRLAGERAGRIGFQGGSQGGYVAPLAATRTHVDFVVSDFGLAVSPIEEDQQEIVLEMKLKGHSDAEIKKALEVADAAATIIRSQFTTGFDRWDALRAKYMPEPWWKDLHGNFTVDFLPHDGAWLKAHAKDFLVGTPMDYQAMPVLEKLDTPQLWELGTDDLAAPSAETSRRLKGLIAQGKPITLAMFPHADHGVYLYETKPDGERVVTRNPDGYIAMMRDFILNGRVQGTYGDSVVTLPKGR
jgi:dienelactone hydrolase